MGFSQLMLIILCIAIDMKVCVYFRLQVTRRESIPVQYCISSAKVMDIAW